MATGVVIRLKNLPLVAGTIDIRRFFTGLRIPDGGVHIIGGNDGTAFILFSTDEDARRAMLQDSQDLRGAKIKLMLSSHTEMKTVIEQSQRICEQLRGQRPPEPPITNLSSQSTASNYQEQFQHSKQPSPKISVESLDVNDVYIEIKGMPYSVSKADITYFFTPLSVSAIKFMLDDKGRKNGSGYIKFATPLEKLHGLKRDRKYIGSRFVKLTSVTERQWLLANSQPNETVRLVSDSSINRKRQQSIVSPEDSTPKRSRDLSPLKTDNCVEVSGLPSMTSFKDVGDLFSRLKFVDSGLFVEMDGSKCKGLAYVEFSSYGDYKQALEKDGDIVNGKQVRVVSMSKQNMLDQISRHKKFCKQKREEQQEKELKKLKEKRSRENDHQKRREHHSRKQKEMEKWLQRQHQKEEKERKMLDANEKRAIQQAEEKKQLQLLLSDKSLLESLKASGEFKLSEELKQKILELSEKPSTDPVKVETFEEPLLGAGEMDIEDEDGSPSPKEQPPQSDSKVQANETVSNSSMGFPVLGNSGSIITPQVPIGFNPAIPLLAPSFAPIPGVPNVQANMANLPFSSGVLPVLANPSFITTKAGGMLNPPPPLPAAGMYPPPIPPVALPTQPANVQSVPQVATSVTALVPAQTEDSEPTPYVRLANTPFKVTEEQLRLFFSGLTILKRGIQFIMKGGRRSGHIFVKFASNEDAATASLKNDHFLQDRRVLVKLATMASLNSIYKHVTKGQIYVPTFEEPKTESVSVNDVDNVFTKRILDDKMTCVCIGNVPPTIGESDIVKLLAGIKVVQNKIAILLDVDGRCKGDVYVELATPEDCVKAANLHGIAKIGEHTVRVLPLTTEAMEKDLVTRQLKPPSLPPLSTPPNGHLPITSSVVASPATGALNRLNESKPAQFNSVCPPFNPRMKTPSLVPPNFPPPPLDPAIPPPTLEPSLVPMQPDPSIPFGAPELMLPPMTEDMLRMPPPPMLDAVMGLPPVPSLPPSLPPSPFFMNRPPINPNPVPVKTIQMSNLSYSVTREDILEFFAQFDPLPDSIRLMYNNNGKLTGDGIITFPCFEAAQAAVKQLNSKVFLSRKIRLKMQ